MMMYTLSVDRKDQLVLIAAKHSYHVNHLQMLRIISELEMPKKMFSVI